MTTGCTNPKCILGYGPYSEGTLVTHTVRSELLGTPAMLYDGFYGYSSFWKKNWKIGKEPKLFCAFPMLSIFNCIRLEYVKFWTTFQMISPNCVALFTVFFFLIGKKLLNCLKSLLLANHQALMHWLETTSTYSSAHLGMQNGLESRLNVHRRCCSG